MRHFVIALVFLAGCATYSPRQYPPPPQFGDCSSGHGHSDQGSGAVVCINRDANGDISADPRQVRVYSNHQLVLMFSDNTGDLDVQFPVTVKVHGNQHGCASGAGATSYRVTAKKVGQSTGYIKYTIIDRETEKQQDPEVQIDP